MNVLIRELTDLTRQFENDGIEYALCGGLALTVHGFPRATFDIDFLIEKQSLDLAYESAAKLGYDIKGLDMSFKERAVEIRRVFKVLEDGEIMSLDLLLVTPAVESVWENKQLLEWQHGTMSNRFKKRVD